MTPSFPKPRLVIEDRIAYKREQEAKGRAFRAQVWTRDGGRCRHCRRIVKRILDAIPERGEVHHLRGRSVDERFNVASAVLLCLYCHQRAQRHEIEV